MSKHSTPKLPKLRMADISPISSNESFTVRKRRAFSEAGSALNKTVTIKRRRSEYDDAVFYGPTGMLYKIWKYITYEVHNSSSIFGQI